MEAVARGFASEDDCIYRMREKLYAQKGEDEKK